MTPPKHSKYSSELEKDIDRLAIDVQYLHKAERVSRIKALINKEKAKAELAGRIAEAKVLSIHIHPNFNQSDLFQKRIDKLEAQLSQDRSDSD